MAPKRAYNLRSSQVPTPHHVVELFWLLLRQHRPELGRVLDMGAGDGRFATGGHFKSYLGVEIDAKRASLAKPGARACVLQGCVFSHAEASFDACIGNPPYLRHQDIESPWKERTLAALGETLGKRLNGHCNLYVYFLALALARTKPDGLIGLVVPFDWVSRPAAAPVRSHILAKSWAVSVYRFESNIFDGVTTTASITIIDKSKSNGEWQYFDVRNDLSIHPRSGVTGTGNELLSYSGRGRIYARRGISPGGQETFILTETERQKLGLHRSDVIPCVTSLRGIKAQFANLTRHAFEKHFVRADRKCWLIKGRGKLSERVVAYYAKIPKAAREISTCSKRKPWHAYEAPTVPALLVHAAFSQRTMRAFINSVGAVAVGTIYGIHGPQKTERRTLQKLIAGANLAGSVVPHSGRLHKIEVRQLNGVLDGWCNEELRSEGAQPSV